jgi:hypothetical protein
MPSDGQDNDDTDDFGFFPERDTITHRHPTLPFVEITQSRYANAEPGDEKFEFWEFYVKGPAGTCTYDNAQYTRGNATEQGMLKFMADKAEKHLLEERGPFFVLRMYLESGEYRREIDAMIRRHGQSPLWRRAEANVTERLGLWRSAARMRCRLRGEQPHF